METLEGLPATIPVTRGCAALGVSRATLYRRTSPPLPPKPRLTVPARALAKDERQKLIDVMHSPEFADQPPREIYAALLSLGIYIASVSTMYRVLQLLSETKERRRGHSRIAHAIPRLEAFGPNQVWTWDITKVRGETLGVFYFVHVIIDLFSRYVVGWMVAETENAKLATHFIDETIARHQIQEGTLTVHSDRGSPMKAGSMTQLLATLSVEQSFSRPRVSNDNPFVESSFKTAKYQPDYPERFGSPTHVRAWFAEFFDWSNEHHHHQGIALFTPSDVFHARVAEVANVRQGALEAQFKAHPERFVRGRPSVKLPPARVHINLPLDDDGHDVPAAAKDEVLPPAVNTDQAVERGNAGATEAPDAIRLATGHDARVAPQQSPILQADAMHDGSTRSSGQAIRIAFEAKNLGGTGAKPPDSPVTSAGVLTNI
jgi:putative transposase|tara:strand:+ start:511 stop:1803 length:1293 start_codon:yes stop_codon:yes gene_type:complete